MASRLEELREKYEELPIILDPYPVLSHGTRYNNGTRSMFRPRARYEQDWEQYVRGKDHTRYGSYIFDADGRFRSVEEGSEEWPSGDE